MESDNTKHEENEQSRWAKRLNGEYVPGKDWKRGTVPVSDLLSRVIDPLCARKGFASSALLAAWPTLAGHQFADCTVPERIQWPHNNKSGVPSYNGGTLIVRVDGPRAIYLQHEEQQILQRVNQFFGFSALTRLKIVQAPIARKCEKPLERPKQLTRAQEQKLADCLPSFDNKALNDAVLRFGKGVLQKALSEK